MAEDVVRLDSDTGELLLTVPANGVVNATMNVSVACATELLSGDRSWDELVGCVNWLVSVWSLQNLRITAFPLRVVWPWDDLATPLANATAAALDAVAPATTAAHVAYDDDDDHDHHARDPYYDEWYVTGWELLYVFFFLSTAAIVCGAVLTESYAQDGWAWSERERRYVRVASKPASAADPEV